MFSTVPDSDLSKRQLRQLLRARRHGLSIGARRRAARQLLQHAQRQPWYIRARSVALYIAADGEIDPQLLLRHALVSGKRVYLPQLRHGNRLGFGEYRCGMRMRRNRFGIPEPQRSRRISITELDVVLLPLVAFDRRGNRLGMGGGFYDRTFARVRHTGNARANAPQLIGLAYRFQKVSSLPREPWDVPLTGVLTERGWIETDR